MKLYLMADDIALRSRWIGAFSALKPTTFSKLSLEIEPNSILMISDELLKEATQEQVRSLFEFPVMILSKTPNFADAQKFMQLGAMGYGNAMMHPTHLYSAYQALSEGKVWLHPDFISILISQVAQKGTQSKKISSILDSLSIREREVALMLGEGSTHQEIADALKITVRTVKAHAASIYQKLNLKDRLALSILLHS